MGEVWKARDTRLDRIVAIKTSNEQFTERFEREARAVAALNHPHICQLYDVGPNYLVMEYIEGQPLRVPLPLDQTLKYGAQICDALDAAHRKGIVHRDLKPANILVTKTGVKLLDFGLARIGPAVTADDKTDGELTGKGQILGTLHYMSPEQLQGEKADSRSDIFSFGLVLYEMLTGKRAFDGSSPASVVAAILEREAPSVAGVAPAILDRVLRRCLAKDPERRCQNASDLKAELEWIAEGSASATTASAPALRKRRQATAWVLAGVFLAALLLAIALLWRTPTVVDVTRFTIYPPERTVFSPAPQSPVSVPQFALSPDGRSMVFVASASGAVPVLWLRAMDDASARQLPGTENAQNPFWSPDNRWVGFFSQRKLKKILVNGGALAVVAEGIASPRGGSWGPDDTIIFSDASNTLHRVTSAGGAIGSATTPDTAQATLRWPQFLPDGRHFLYSVRSGLSGKGGIYVGSLDGTTKKFLVPNDVAPNGLYAAPGYLLYVDGGTLFGQAFDADRLELSGQKFIVAQEVGLASNSVGAFSVSRNGTLAYAKTMYLLGRLKWFDRRGNPLDSGSPEGDYPDFRLSPDAAQLASSLVNPKTNMIDIWLTDLARGNARQFTFSTGGALNNSSALWSPDSQWILWASSQGLTRFYERSATSGTSIDVPVFDAGQMVSVGVTPTDWSSDGGNVIFALPSVASGTDLWLLPMAGEHKPTMFLQAPGDQWHGNFSPNGLLVAYSSNESGRFEVYVSTMKKDRQWQVSINGGYEPRWRKDGSEIYYLSEDRRLMAVSVGAIPVSGGTSPFSIPKPLFQTGVTVGVSAGRTHFVPSGDGQRFLINTQVSEPSLDPITIVLNWTAGLKK
jgi:Tol biopolymer transport system component